MTFILDDEDQSMCAAHGSRVSHAREGSGAVEVRGMSATRCLAEAEQLQQLADEATDRREHDARHEGGH